MKALFIKSKDGKINNDILQIPKPGKGEVLVKLESSQIDPADLNIIRKAYLDRLRPGGQVILGIEGIGTVISSGDNSDESKSLIGKKVAFGTVKGAWAEYCIVETFMTIIIDDHSSDINNWPSFSNPVTVLCFLDIIRNKKSKAVVHTGASSSLGIMFAKICQKFNITLINTVKTKNHFKPLEEIGEKIILAQDDPEFRVKLRSLVKEHKPNVCFESVAGELFGIVFNIMPPESTTYLYGSLSLRYVAGISPPEMIYFHKDILHLQLTWYMQSIPIERKKQLFDEGRILMSECFGTKVSKKFSFDDIYNALEFYQKNMSKGKVLLYPKF